MSASFALNVRYYRLADELAPYFTVLYRFDLDCAEGDLVQDQLHPEWSALRFTQSGTPPQAGITPDPMLPTYPLVASGPTSRAIRFGLTRSRIWGLGLHPAGWARFVQAPANSLADRIVNAGELEAFAAFHPVAGIVQGGGEDPDETARQVNAHLLALPRAPFAAESQVLACQAALRDPDMADVTQLAARLGVNRRSLERLCGRYFGFPPKLLLRRQRFLRSLARYMLQPLDTWSDALDLHYYDHAHFVRDFRSFMGMTPTEYAEMPHPIIERIMAQRMADQGAAPQTDLPTVARYGAEVRSLD
ncbi:helix-turn-helix domain-containing protein [Alteraurantiacibacter buctensis]|uniref:Helix-turn-helix domain-containing protein n=1 Tax=Alteraurantiacibacter buctensis TaxID=1503981 RepID=A0A844YUU6_9SPHN|nr:helix-turn-helix domain-containing protein [Alteraurantiacibacter buctensis]MXO70648.1 helix-turn-helix domain-containing protein [Alteraurantiacibacter buctensis]